MKYRLDQVYRLGQVTDDGLAELILDDLNLICNRKFRVNSKTEKTIKARLAEGFTFEDFQHVHRVKFLEWGSNPKMCAYLRPSTLYRPDNFQSYLNQSMEAAKLAHLSPKELDQLKSRVAIEGWTPPEVSK